MRIFAMKMGFLLEFGDSVPAPRLYKTAIGSASFKKYSPNAPPNLLQVRESERVIYLARDACPS